jgi:hypothetical protein
MDKHTPESWEARGVVIFYCPDGDVFLIGKTQTKKDARRIVACVNACAGMDDPAVEIKAKDTRIAELEEQLSAEREKVDRLRDNLLLVRDAYLSQPERQRTENVCLVGEMDGIIEALSATDPGA